MRRFTGHHTGNIFPVGVTNLDFVGGNIVFHPSAQRDKLQGTIGLDRLHHKAYLIAVAVQENDRLISSIFIAIEKQVPDAVFFDSGQPFAVFAAYQQHVVFKSGRAVCVGKFFDHFQ